MKTQPLQDFLNLLFPRLCVNCSRPLSSVEKHLCLHCAHDMPVIIDQQEVIEKLAGRIPFVSVVSLLKFKPKGMTQKLLHELKYRSNTEVGEYLGNLLATRFEEKLRSLNIDMVVPVPLHSSKRRKRGYNQSSFIARGIGDKLAIPVNEKVIKRLRNSSTQTRKSRQQRWLNVSEIFAVVKESDVEGKHVLIVDDVFTTGATLEACGQKIIEAGGRVSFATIASA